MLKRIELDGDRALVLPLAVVDLTRHRSCDVLERTVLWRNSGWDAGIL